MAFIVHSTFRLLRLVKYAGFGFFWVFDESEGEDETAN